MPVVARLLVLGILRMCGRAHGYQIRQTLLSWSADEWANLRGGSIYHALRKLAEEGLLNIVGRETGDAAPDRTVYEMTEQGEALFFRLVSRGISDADSSFDELSAAATFLPALGRTRAVDALTARISALEARLSDRRRAADALASDKPEHTLEVYELGTSRIETELSWARRLCVRLHDGAFVMAGESPNYFGRPGSLQVVLS